LCQQERFQQFNLAESVTCAIALYRQLLLLVETRKAPFLAVWASAGAELGTDILRYTDVAPIIQFNEIKISVPA
jgi:hypothetical protein